jgi:hypothetical protein
MLGVRGCGRLIVVRLENIAAGRGRRRRPPLKRMQRDDLGIVHATCPDIIDFYKLIIEIKNQAGVRQGHKMSLPQRNIAENCAFAGGLDMVTDLKK